MMALDPLVQTARNDLAEGHLDRAEAALRQRLALQPEDAEALHALGLCCLMQQQTDRAQQYFREASHLCPDNRLWRWQAETVCPVILTTGSQASAYRDHLRSFLEEVQHTPFDVPLSELPFAMLEPSFFLVYQGENDCEIKQQYGQLLTAMLKRTVPHLMQPLPVHPTRKRRRIGFLVTHRHEGIFCKIYGLLADQLDRERFEVTLICGTRDSAAAIALELKNRDTDYLILPRDLESQVQVIRRRQLDGVFHFEVGTDATNYWLPYFHLAPVQCTSMGLPVTSGIPAMTHVVSSRLTEGPDADTHYSEALYQLETYPATFRRPKVPAGPRKRRSNFGLPSNQTVYLCPQSLPKLHPDFDPILMNILRQDPDGILVLLEGHGATTEQVKQRLFQQLRDTPDIQQRIVFLKRVSSEDFLELLRLADVMLDPPHMSGGVTSHEAFVWGTPIVTLPSPYFRGRLTLGCYRAMDLMECVVSSPAEYVEKAVALGRQPQKRAELRQQILARNSVLYDNPANVRAFEQFFIDAIEQALPVSDRAAQQERVEVCR